MHPSISVCKQTVPDGAKKDFIFLFFLQARRAYGAKKTAPSWSEIYKQTALNGAEHRRVVRL